MTTPNLMVGFTVLVLTMAFMMKGEALLSEMPAKMQPELEISVADQSGSLAFVNVMSIGGGVQVAIECQNSVRITGPFSISKGETYRFTFIFDAAVNDPYQCKFLWLGELSTQTFNAWTHDGSSSYLSACDHCAWKIEDDGFYILNEVDKLYYRLYEWTI